MPTLTITAKGQITLRKEVLRHLGVGPGDKVNVGLAPGGTVSVTAAPVRSGSIANVFGMLASEEGPVLTQDEIRAAIDDAWSARERRD